MIKPGEYVSVAEFAHRAGVDKTAVLRWIWAGSVRAVRVGSAYVIPAAEIADREAGPESSARDAVELA